MIKGKPRKAPGEGAFPLERAKQLYAAFGPEGQDMTFGQFYRELCGIANPKKMEDDLAGIELTMARERSQRLLIDRGLLRANK